MSEVSTIVSDALPAVYGMATMLALWVVQQLRSKVVQLIRRLIRSHPAIKVLVVTRSVRLHVEVQSIKVDRQRW